MTLAGEPREETGRIAVDAGPSQPAPDLVRTALQLLALGALILSTFWVVRPFLGAGAWATMIAVATWPVFQHVERWLGGRRGLAVAAMTSALLLVLFVPLYFSVTTIVANVGRIEEWSKALGSLTIPPLPAWAATLPLIGPKLAARWQQVAAATPEEISAQVAPVARSALLWFAGQVGGLGLLLLQFLLTVIVAAILFVNGETAADAVRRFARRLAGERGVEVVDLAARAMRAVALGVVVTAVIQAGFVALGLTVAGVPFVSILTAISFMLCVAQIGPALVLVPVSIWVYTRSGPVWGTVFLVWAIVCSTLDNFLRPVLIKRGADLPLLLIFAGVIGGLLALGVMGLFVGPVVLAVTYTLLGEWLSDADRTTDGRASPRPT